MTKKAFLRALKRRLQPMTREEREATLAYYAEIIDDGMENGLEEQAMIAALGDVDAIAAQLCPNVPARKADTTKTILAAMGSPLWIPILAALVLIALSLLLVALAAVWTLVLAVWLVEFSLLACAFAGLAGGMAMGMQGNYPRALALLSIFLAGMGLLLLFLPLTRAATRGGARLTAKLLRSSYRLLRGRRIRNEENL